jgi:hypothetical protein
MCRVRGYWSIYTIVSEAIDSSTLDVSEAIGPSTRIVSEAIDWSTLDVSEAIGSWLTWIVSEDVDSSTLGVSEATKSDRLLFGPPASSVSGHWSPV